MTTEHLLAELQRLEAYIRALHEQLAAAAVDHERLRALHRALLTPAGWRASPPTAGELRSWAHELVDTVEWPENAPLVAWLRRVADALEAAGEP